jgi:PRC-barrel domain/EF hand
VAASAAPTLVKASDWLCHVVSTRDGKELGTVRDFAIDESTGKVVYVVVSVGSYLIENNLIAVAPDALEPQPNQASGLLLEADPAVLPKAQRFATDSRWPDRPDVLRDTAAVPPTAVAESSAEQEEAAPVTGTATIESPSKTAHLSASERYIKPNPNAPAPAATPKPAPKTASATKSGPPPITTFDKLDKDGDGVLNRAEFAHVITPSDSYSKIDANANGVIDRQEFEAYQAAHGDAS